MEDPRKYDAHVDLELKNNSHTQLILLTGRDKRVLETGCATGYVSRVLKEQGCHVTGLEVDPAAAEIASGICDRVIVGNIEEMDLRETFGDERFDVIMFGDVLEHLVDPLRVLRDVRQLLAPGGSVVASVPNVAHGSVRLALMRGEFRYTELGLLDETHLRFFTRESLSALFRDAGFTIKTWRSITVDPFGTELGLKEDEYPAYLAESIRRDREAMTYQYVVRAEMADAPAAGNGSAPSLVSDATRPARSHAMATLWQVAQDAAEAERAIDRYQRETEEQQETIAKLKRDLQETRTGLHHANMHLQAVTGSIGWRLLELLRKPIHFVAPPGTPQRGLLVAVKRGLGLLRRKGPLALAARVVKVWEWPETIGKLSRRPPPNLDLNGQYQLWLKRHAITDKRARQIRKQISKLGYRPRISIIVPVYNPEPDWLRDTIESVRSQLYEDWELCLADDCSTREGVRELLLEYEQLDSRIKVTYLEKNLNISGASNAALSLATGDYIGLLDHDDQLRPHALFEVVRLLNERPETDYLYTDEDKMEMDGTQIDPFLKPDWSPDMLFCLNYVTHFSVYRRELVERAGGFRLGFEGSQDYDLVLRVTEMTDNISHIPLPLYSWRKVPGSAASSPEAKNYAYDAARRAIAEALERRGTPGQVWDGIFKGYYRVRYELRDTQKVAIVIPTRDKVDLLRRCIDSIREKSTYTNYEIIIIDNQSQDPETIEYLRTYGGRVIPYPHEFNYSRQMNVGVEQAGCEYVILLNNDTEVITPDWIEAMLEYAQREDVAAVGARLFFPDGTVQHEGVFIGCGNGLAGHIDHRGYFALGDCVRNLSAVTAACMMVKAPLYLELGGLEEDLRVAYNDVDFCLKAREKGYNIIYTPYAELYHHEGGTRGRVHPKQNEQLFRKRWWRKGFRDPYYNPNWDLDYPFNLRV